MCLLNAMFNPSELEGEVDHAFFDSDCDDKSTNRDGVKNMEKGLKTVDKSQLANKSPHDKFPEKTNACVSPRTGGATKHLQDLVYHKDVCTQSPEETEEEELPFNAKHSALKSKNKHSPKKQIRYWRTQRPSPTSDEASMDADSESSCSSSNGRSSSRSPNFPTPNTSSSFPKNRKVSVGSAGSRDVPTSPTGESDDTVTDVSTISSPDISPIQSLDLNQNEAAERSQREEQREESVPSSGLSNTFQDEDSDHNIDECE